MQTIAEILSAELGQKLQYIENVITLMDEGNTIPFIARYRKEMHGAMDDTVLRTLETRLTYLRNLQERRDEVKKSIENQGKLTEELSAAIDAAATLAEVEDLYRPYKQKRRTRGTVAREKGLEGLAAAIFAQDGQDPAVLAEGYIDPEKGVNTIEEALQGANDIIAEDLSDDADCFGVLLILGNGDQLLFVLRREIGDLNRNIYLAHPVCILDPKVALKIADNIGEHTVNFFAKKAKLQCLLMIQTVIFRNALTFLENGRKILRALFDFAYIGFHNFILSFLFPFIQL